jgi:predicted ribosomally synthesized peptide with nif11-like leader
MFEKFSIELKAFFERILVDQDLQKRLYNTVELSDVARIANELGYKVTAAEIIRAQAVRIQESSDDQLDILAAGNKPETVAQWGREGKGFLERAGYWFVELLPYVKNTSLKNTQLARFIKDLNESEFLKKQIRQAYTFNLLFNIVKELGYSITLYELIHHQASVIEGLNDEIANRVASGGKDLY